MKFKEYQKQTLTTVVSSVNRAGEWRPVYLALGMCGEAGELAEEIKKMARDDGNKLTKDRKKRIKKEAGDVLWYLTVLLDSCDLTLDEVAEANLAKLQGRKEAGTIGGSGSAR